jgi:hypothetical protein
MVQTSSLAEKICDRWWYTISLSLAGKTRQPHIQSGDKGSVGGAMSSLLLLLVVVSKLLFEMGVLATILQMEIVVSDTVL